MMMLPNTETPAETPRAKALEVKVSSGHAMTLDDLPPPDTQRWVARRKAQVVTGVRIGLISLDDACRRYALTVEEFLSWARAVDRHGVRGLRVTRLQEYR